ncbi:hypothetical protein OKW38_001215 [Paraburkholderia sp. MM5496-R1]|uniref:hypothetical protein n=1 Tax=unclassified Paraburkholderia TaxID=2615204 RepID=UPI003D20BF97
MNHMKVLNSVVEFSRPIEVLESEVAKLPWDSESALVELSSLRLASALDRFLTGQLTFDALSRWAELIEVREDIDLPRDATREAVKLAISRLANASLETESPAQFVKEIRKTLTETEGR